MGTHVAGGVVREHVALDVGRLEQAGRMMTTVDCGYT
jgi:hypothetical protein